MEINSEVLTRSKWS